MSQRTNEFFAALNIKPRPLVTRNGWASCEAYVGASDLARATAAGFHCSCRKLGKAWSLSVRADDLVDDEERENARIDID